MVLKGWTQQRVNKNSCGLVWGKEGLTYLVPPQNKSWLSLFTFYLREFWQPLLFTHLIEMWRTYTPTPESELTEEEVRRWFNRLRELYQEALHRIHDMKAERGKLRDEAIKLKHQIRVLTKENKKLKEGGELKVERVGATQKVKMKVEMSDFRKKFFDNL